MTTTGQIRWNRDAQHQQEGVTTTLTLNCRSNGQIHLETPTSQGAFSADYSSPNEAMQGLVSLFEQGCKQASGS